MTPYITRAERDAIRAVIETPEKWTQRVDARDKNGIATFAQDSDATCFCLMGAVWRTIEAAENRVRIIDVLDSVCDGYFAAWNDAPKRTHAEILAMLDSLPVVEEEPT